jgi:hypothetical protein
MCFHITSLFLRTCFNVLMKKPEETLFYLSGPEIGGVVVLDHMIHFDLAVQEVTYVQGNIVSVAEALEDIHCRGFSPRGTAHCHPCHGESGTCPSGIDLEHHGMLEAAGYKMVGMIMGRDGHCRFYSNKMPFQVEVIGNDVVRLGENTYRLLLDFNGGEQQQA